MRYFTSEKFRFFSFIVWATLLLFMLTYYVTGFIPVSSGAGWDGSVYLNYVQVLASGSNVTGDPYREIRMPGFLFLILAAKLGVLPSQIVTVQAVLNAALLSMSAGLIYNALLHLKVKKHVSLISIGTLVFTWPFLVMPVFYPILSDHIALAISCLCIWCWSRSICWPLYFLAGISLWILPSLFIIPMLLSVFPISNNSQTFAKTKLIPSVLLTLICITLVLSFIPSLFGNVTSELILSHSSDRGGPTALIELKLLSTVCATVAMALIAWMCSSLVTNIDVWKSINPKSTLLVIFTTIASGYYMYTNINWASGFTGPPLTQYMALQTLALPFKPLISNIANLTPTLAIAILIITKYTLGKHGPIPIALIATFIAFLPFLIFGSESRQWIGALPILVLIFAMADLSLRQRLWCLVTSFVLISPMFWLHSKSINAVQSGAGLQSSEWQYYFGRQGPWMSVESYEISLMLCVVFIAGHLMLAKKNPEQPKT